MEVWEFLIRKLYHYKNDGKMTLKGYGGLWIYASKRGKHRLERDRERKKQLHMLYFDKDASLGFKLS